MTDVPDGAGERAASDALPDADPAVRPRVEHRLVPGDECRRWRGV